MKEYKMSVKRLFRKIKTGISNLWYWLPIIWKDRQWDSYYLEVILLHKLKRMHRFYKGDNLMQVKSSSDEIVEDIESVLSPLERLVDGDYINLPKGMEPEMLLTSSEEASDYNELTFRYHKDFPQEKVFESYQQSYINEAKDRELVYTILKEKSTRWWD